MRRGLECSIGWRKIEITSESIYYDFYFNQLLVIFILSKNNITNVTISYDSSIEMSTLPNPPYRTGL